MEEKKFFNFKSNEEFDLNKEYFNLFEKEEFDPINPDEKKLKDAEEIIREVGAKYLESTSLQEYENIFINLNEFLIRFRTDSKEVKEMTKDDRDKLWAYGKELFTAYQDKYRYLNFNFELSIKEWNYVDHTLTKKLSYNGTELFNYWELYTHFIEPTRTMVNNLPKEIESFIPTCSIQDLVLLSHLLMKHEEKASTESFHHFRNVLTEVAQMTKLFNAYGVILERIGNRYTNWVNSINAMDNYNNDNRVDVTTK
jgi:hypothetical protein